MKKDERITLLKAEIAKNIQKLERLIESSDRKQNFPHALDVMKLYFSTRDKIENLMPKIQKM